MNNKIIEFKQSHKIKNCIPHFNRLKVTATNILSHTVFGIKYEISGNGCLYCVMSQRHFKTKVFGIWGAVETNEL